MPYWVVAAAAAAHAPMTDITEEKAATAEV